MNKKGMDGMYVAVGIIIGLVAGIALMWWLLSAGILDVSLFTGGAAEAVAK